MHKNKLLPVDVHRRYLRSASATGVAVTRRFARWLCSIFDATVLFLISGPFSATAQEQQAMKALRAIGTNALVRVEFESALGAVTRSATYLENLLKEYRVGSESKPLQSAGTLNEAPAVMGPYRTISIVGLGDLEANPSFKVPLGDLGRTRWQYELKSIPIGTLIAGATGGGVAGAAAVKTLSAGKERDTLPNDVRN